MRKTLFWENGGLMLLDQTALPSREVYIRAESCERVAAAIKNMEVRGAPAIGLAAAYGFALGALSFVGAGPEWREHMKTVARVLSETRPTAVNLFWALRRMENKLHALHAEYDVTEPAPEVRAAFAAALLAEAEQMAVEDERDNRLLGAAGAALVPENAAILTHCNAGALATGAYGTALGVVRAAREAGKNPRIYACETRPCLQGARLTAWELWRENIPVTLITDGMAAYLMRQGKIDLVLVGADRIAANGDIANKIGTYALAVLAQAHSIPFYAAAPTSTVDLRAGSGDDIPVEERDGDEVRRLAGVQIAPPEVSVYNPSFDITPVKYITGLITEKGALSPPSAAALLKLIS
ncbi:MAG: S-methyl-5-thioribose-1-phosphate isomerase [Gracilibacteraceae bacterium]|jgi:methylthioribose-1-phosphate isomerase|nr:S-methyl-5-thioribose-1-phosphate isomerase [Gracilibacteraceae bacterium]